MKILVTGNMGYLGPVVVKQLKISFPEAIIVGVDTGYYAHCLTNPLFFPECRVDVQYFADIRFFPSGILTDVDTVVHLAAISNDPISNTFADVTYQINHQASVKLANLAKQAGVKSFIFASSCSVYGLADDSPRTEYSELNPLTPYAKSKILTENDLRLLANSNFTITCLRFATACGMSDRLRLDLVLNDFVASAYVSQRITILSDGTPWRPLINVKDMARAIDWAVKREVKESENFLSLNAGSNEWNFQVRDLAIAVKEIIPHTEIQVNQNAAPDKRSYKVDFGLFNQFVPPEYRPQQSLKQTVEELVSGLAALNFRDEKFRESTFIRLNVLRELQSHGLINENLEWCNI